MLAALLGLFVALAAGVEDLSLKDFDFAQVAGSGRLPWGTGPPRRAWETLQDLLPLEPLPAPQRAGPGISQTTVLLCGRGWPLILAAALPGQPPSSSPSPQFSGIWFEIAFAPNLEPQGSPRTKKMGP